jgi:hypothetical protein
VLGRVLRQAGVMAKLAASGALAQTEIAVTEAGVSGSFQSVASFPAGTFNAGQAIIPCSQASPISNSNLVFVREGAAGATMATGAVSVLALLV